MLFEHRAAEGPADERCHHRLSQCRAPLSPTICAENSGHYPGASWADIPQRYGPPTTCVNRFNRQRKAGGWDRILNAVSKAYNGDIQMIDSSSIRVH